MVSNRTHVIYKASQASQYIETPAHGILTPYPWYIEPAIPGISSPLFMVFRLPPPPCLWYFDPPPPMVYRTPTHGILSLLSMVYQTTYAWYIESPTHGISNPLPMVYRTLYPWCIEPLTHGTSYPLSITISWLEMRGFKIPWGDSFFNKGVQYTMGFKITYDTGIS